MNDEPVIIVPDQSVLEQIGEAQLDRIEGESDVDFEARKAAYARLLIGLKS